MSFRYFWYPGDYARDTAHLTDLQDLYYRRLLDHYYMNKSLPSDFEQLSRIVKIHTKKEKNSLQFVLQNFFIFTPTNYINLRVEKELAETAEVSHKRRESAIKRWQEKNANAYANGYANALQMDMQTGMQNGCKTDALSSPSPSSSSSKKKTNPRAKNPRTPPPSAFVLPDWIPSDAWNDFEDHRKTIRKPLTDKSRKLAVAELSKLRDLGYPPDDVLAQSILNGWTGLFPLKGFSRPGTNGSHPPRKKTLIEQVLEANGITAEDIQSDKEILDVDETAY
jgi:uncharacterized protein YdaU (DUF1376 family)